jgi:tetratricopeptide (TPR) repeat protein
LEQVDGTWQVREGAAIDLPLAVRSVVARRLTALGSLQRQALAMGAVLGQEFRYAALEAMWRDGSALFPALDRLTTLHLLTETEDGYAFPHPVLHEVVYDTLPIHLRRCLHRQAGCVLEQMYGEDAGEHAAELAHHYLQGMDSERALLHSVRAGENAEAAFSYQEAAEHYRTAIELMRSLSSSTDTGSEDEADLLLNLGKALRMTAQREEAIAALDEAVMRYQALGDSFRESRALVNLAKTHTRGGAGEEAARALARVECLLASTDLDSPNRDLALFYDELGSLYFRMGRYEALLATRDRQVSVARDLADEQLLIRAEIGRAIALSMVGRPQEGGRLAEELIPRAEASGDSETLRLGLAQAAEAAMLAGSFARSRGYRERELRVAENLGDAAVGPFSLANLAQLLVYLGDWEEARRAATRAIDELIAVGSASRAVYPRSFLGELLLRQGKWDEAEAHLEESCAVAGRIGDLQALRYAQRLLAELDLLRGQPKTALARLNHLLDRAGFEEADVTYLLPTLAWAHLEDLDLARAPAVASEALRRATAQGHLLAKVDARRVQGMILVRQARWQEAQQVFHESESLAWSMPYPYAGARAQYERGMAYVDEGRFECAQEALLGALAGFRSLYATKDIERTEQALEGIMETKRQQHSGDADG